MSNIVKVNKRCVICGKVHACSVVISTNTFGYMDLDTRPAPMKRDLLHYEIEYCDNCHYANDDISKLIVDLDIKELKTNEYYEIYNDSSIDMTAKSYLLAAFLYSKSNHLRQAGLLYLKAAWVLDDLKDERCAQIYRKKAIDCLSAYLENVDDENLEILLVDLYRRIHEFATAKEHAILLLDTNIADMLKAILSYELSLIKNQDSECHNLGEIR